MCIEYNSHALSTHMHVQSNMTAQNPNVLTMTDGSGSVVETKVTKRSFEARSIIARGRE